MSIVERILFVALVAAAMSAGLTIAFVVGLAVIVWLSAQDDAYVRELGQVARSRPSTGCGPKRRAHSKKLTAAQSAEALLKPAAQLVMIADSSTGAASQ
jgi:hypothetical protein